MGRIFVVGVNVQAEPKVIEIPHPSLPQIFFCKLDGAVVIPKVHVAHVVKEGAEQERFEAWIIGELKKGVKLTDLYPPTPETKARYEASKK